MTPFSYALISGPTHRLTSSRYPTIGVFDNVRATAEEARVGFMLEQLTNPRFDAVTRHLNIIPDDDIVIGTGSDGASIIMAAFLHTDDAGSRFSDSDLGAWYAGRTLETAIAETRYHNERRLRSSEGGFPNRVQMRELIAILDVEALDLRGQRAARPELYHLTDYTQSQAFARSIRWPFNPDAPETAVVYDSLRHDSGENVCIFRPKSVSRPVKQAAHYEYVWDKNGNFSYAPLKLTPLNIN